VRSTEDEEPSAWKMDEAEPSEPGGGTEDRGKREALTRLEAEGQKIRKSEGEKDVRNK
jgi:hypothetical protein